MDIRNFFGAKAKKTSEPEKVQPEKKRLQKDESVDLIDSDNDNAKNELPRKRLRPSNQKVEESEPEARNIVTIEEDPPIVISKAKTLPVKRANTEPENKTKPEEDIDIVSPKKSKTATKTPKKAAKTAMPTVLPQSRVPLENMRIAVSGITRQMSRENLEQRILELGGKVASAVSGKTTCLVVGDMLEDGRTVQEGSKYRTAVEKGVPILTEDEFFALLATANLNSTSDQQMEVVSSPPPVIQKRAATISTTTSTATTSTVGHSTLKSTESSLWVDKYSPKSPTELVGHAEIAKKLADWLKNWNNIHISKSNTASSKPSYGGYNNKENTLAKAVLLSGPPGIGKTSVATIVAKYLKYEVLELNASDTRSKNELDRRLVDALTTRAMNLGQNTLSVRSRVVIMDEVDGMGGSDRGGIAELIKLLKTSKVPVICICNDRQSPKIRSLANHCYDLRVKRPTKTQIGQRLLAIGEREGLQVDLNAAEMLVEQSGNDIRQSINALQMWKCGHGGVGKTMTVTYQEMKHAMQRIEKDKVLRNTPFDACLQLISGGKTDWNERYNSYFIDYSLIPLLVQQNYIDASKSGVFRDPSLSDELKFQALSDAAAAVSDLDLLGSAIRGQDQHWELLPAQAVMTMKVGHHINGFQAFPTFPMWLGRYSASTKTYRLVTELVHHTALTVGQGFGAMRLDYAPYLRKKLVQPLVADGKESVSKVIEMLDEYGLTRDDMMETLKDLTLKIDANQSDYYDQIDSQVKSAFTRQYNSTSHTSQAIVGQALTSLGKKKGKTATAAAEDEEDLLLELESGDVEAPQEEEEDEEENIEELRAKLAKKSGKKGGKAAATSSGTTAKAPRKKK